jgi:hypothetical protein
MISGFAIALAINLVLSIASGIFSIYMMFTRDSQAELDSCTQNANDTSDATVQSCKKGLFVVKAVMIGVYVFIWLIQLCKFFFSIIWCFKGIAS